MSTYKSFFTNRFFGPVQPKLQHPANSNVSTKLLISFLLILALISISLAFSPAAGGLGEPVYNLLVNDITQGFIGMTVAVGLLCFGAYLASKNLILGLPPFVGAGVVYASEEIATGMGFILM
ncbi:hypothetical protein Selin_1455 [Desulfurispirillum indicum S5]|uniref:Uncharacterized protein n=1 Tax=Desulfurispirillum indicum (strain ATCC BAA-1389 / DSM 22839 / S5) TaxID=653733 RepID=E6W6U6_DESIS|nr:hypothetical protein [Desulfurispirillum indicum]ADU66189.1 hypothetical protein Selin_1455 [Desulfurispirillum indicum S5]